METSAPTKLPFSVLGEFAQSPVAQSTQPSAQLGEASPSEANPESVAVPIGVLEVPIGVWGSRRVETDSGQAERVEVFAEDTCTVIVFPQGAVIRLSASVAAGQLVVIANRKSTQIMLCRIVNVRTYPNIRGYAEIEFMHSATGFWGSYASQGTLRLAAKVGGNTVGDRGFLEQWLCEGSGFCSCKRRDRLRRLLPLFGFGLRKSQSQTL